MEPKDLEHAGAGTKSSPQSSQNSGGNPQTTVHHRAPVESPAKSCAVTTSIPTRATAAFLPPLPAAPQPVGRPPADAAQTSPPQQPQLKVVPSPSGIVLSWCVAETDLICATVDSYHLYAFHQDNSNTNSATQQHWKRIGEVKALPLPMACTLTQFQAGVTYHFAVQAKDMYGRFGSFCDPQCTNAIISPNSGIKGAGTRSSPQSSQNSGGNPKTTVQHCAPVESPAKSRAVTTSAPTPATATVLPPLPTAIQPVGQLPAEATETSPPQQLQLKVAAVPDHLKQQKPGELVLSWWVAENDLTCATVAGYDLYAFRQDNPNANSATQKHWKRFAELKALPLPMACTVAQVQSQASATYHFAILAKDIYGRFGSFCDPQCTVIGPNSG